MIIRCLILIIFCSPILAQVGSKSEAQLKQAVVTEENTIIYEKPDVTSNAIRLLYVGEYLIIRDVVKDDNQVLWTQVKLGENKTGFIPSSNLKSDISRTQKKWSKPSLLRDEKPLAFSLRAGGELLGGGLNLHYLPFSRLGSSFSVGSIVDENAEMKGTGMALGVVTYLALKNLSPLIELGFSKLSYHEKYATLRMNSFYLTLGLEWIFASGVYVNVIATYIRSADVEVAFNYSDATAGRMSVPTEFGILDPGDGNTFQFLLPGFSIGYAF